MALTLKDRVLESSVSTGTGDFVLSGAQTGYQTFGVAGDGATVPYTIQGKNIDGTLTGDWEVGIGTYTLSTNSISRDTVLESSNANAKVFFPAGDKDIFLDVPGERIVQSATIAVSNNFVAYDGVTGQLLKDSGSKASDFATSAQGAKADTAVQQAVVGQPNGVASLDSTGKVPTSQIPQMGDLNYQGTWNASTNTPTLASSTGTKGYYYVVSVSGSTNLDGITDWVVGDWAVFNGTVWQKIDNTDLVTSVNGHTGAVVLTYSDVGAQPAGSYAPATSGTSILYGNGSGGFSNVTIGTGVNFAGGTLSATGTGGDVVGPSSATDNAIARFDTTTGKLIQNSVGVLSDTGSLSGITNIQNINYVDFDTTYATTLTEGQLGWDGNNTLGLGMAGGNVIQHIGEDQFFYCKATSSISKGQVVMFTGAVGASGVPTGAPATGITDGTYIMGIAAEAIALNGFGLVQTFGTLRNVNTSGYADGDILWYNPSVTGGLTKTKPSAPNIKAQMAAVINGGSSGGGTILIRINPGSTLGGTDSNAQINGGTNGQIISYDGGNGYYTNTTLTAGTAISVSTSANGVLTIANTAPDQVVSLTGAGTTTVTGTYPSFTITSNDAYTGTVTSVSGTAPISVATGTTTPVVSMTQATGSVNGWLSSTDWTTFNNKQAAYTNLTTIGSLANGAGWLYNNGSGTFSYLTPTKTDVGLGNVTNDTQTKAAVVPNTAPTAGQILVGNAGGTAYAPVSASGDATLASTGALTLATVNSNVGSFTNASVTVNAKGLVTAVSSGTAPVTTFSAGTTGFTPSTATSGAVTLAGTLNVANGGTGVTASTGANSVVLRDASQTINVANTFGFKNRIINGAMMIDQRNAGASVTPTLSNQYTLDRWFINQSASSKVSVQQNAGSVTLPTGFTNYLGITSLAATTVGAADYYQLRYKIEGYNVADLGFGTSSPSTITISFWVRSSLTGTFSFAVMNDAENRYYPTTYTINSANTWEQKTITLTGDTTGTWLKTNGGGLTLNFSLGIGSNYTTSTANAWTGANGYGISSTVNFVSTNAATLYITGVQLEKGSTATSFDYRPYGTELALCQRYYFNDTKYVAALVSGVAATGTNYPVEMRAAPTITGGTAGFAEVVKTAKGLYYYQNVTSGQTLTFTSEL